MATATGPTVASTALKVTPMSMAWSELTVSVQVKSKQGGMQKRILVDSAAGIVHPGETLGIMGPSGSGKTTLLSSLAGRDVNASVEGKVLVGGRAPDRFFKRVACFVPQEDSLMGVLTVHETLQFAAALAGYTDKDARDRLVETTIRELGLEIATHTKVGDVFYKGCSGGQKRRVSIGVELLKQPSLIILDEPTSGLDSASAFGVMKNLKALAGEGRTIMATIHQPSSEVLSMLDKVCILSRGKPIYFGSLDNMVPYFSTLGHVCPSFSNPADFVLAKVNTDFPGHADLDVLAMEYRTRQEPEIVAEVTAVEGTPLASPDTVAAVTMHRKDKEYPSSYWNQFAVLVHRNTINLIKNPGIIWIRLFMYTMLSLMIGLMYLNTGDAYSTISDRISFLFYVDAFMVFMAIAVLPFFIQMRAVFMRERANGSYAVGPYVLANALVSIPGIAVISIVSTLFVYLMTDLHSGASHFFIFFVDLFLSLMCSEAFMSVMAALVPHYIVGIALGSGVFGMFMLCQGFFIVRDDIPNYWIWGYYLAFHTYSFRVFLFNEFDGLTFDAPKLIPGLNPADIATVPRNRVTGKQVLQSMDMDDVNIGQDLGILVVQLVLYQLLLYIILRLKYRAERPKKK